MTSLTSLIERIEAATEPDRELDCAIFCATAESPFQNYYPDCVLASQGGFAARIEVAEIPYFTSSIDTALTLLPLGYEYDLTNMYGVARVSVGLNCEPGPFYGANECGSMPLALLAAILRARQTEGR